MRRLLVATLVIGLSVLAGQACSSASSPGNPPGSTPDAGVPDGGLPDGGVPDGGSGGGTQCLTAYAACSGDASCCSGSCVSGKCANPYCAPPGGACQAPGDCCAGTCSAVGSGVSACVSCKPSGTGAASACSAASDCCSGLCTGNTCVAPAGGGSSCHVTGDACTAGTDCCSTNCQGGRCVAAYACQAAGDLCTSPSDCCSNLCSATGGQPGRCLDASGQCHQGGSPCSSGSNCCSSLCVDLGSGARVCQPATGCRLQGDACNQTSECCRADSSQASGMDESVECSPTDKRCTQGTACQNVGLTCGAPVLPGGGSINAPQDCCDGHKAVCKLDSSGIPRCFGGCPTGNCDPNGPCPTGYTGSAPCCIAAGAVCQFKDQCCGGLPCVPDAQGTLRCTTPQCTPLGASCDPVASSCCEGTCDRTVEGSTVCRVSDPPSDGGVPDGGTACKQNGSTCSANGDCCSTYCVGGTCQAPRTCQPQGGTCTAAADCCTGLSCSVTPGQAAGLCQPGATCPGAGQQCSPTQPCCPGLLCNEAGTYTACGGTTACICGFNG